MKRFLTILLLAALLGALTPGARAASDAFSIAPDTVFYDMRRSWRQGYEGQVLFDKLLLTVPVTSDAAVGKITAEIHAEDEALSPFRAQKMTAQTQRVSEGLWSARFSLALQPDRLNGDYPCRIRVTGRDADGNALTSDLPYLFRIRDGQARAEPVRLELTDEGTALELGQPGEVCLRVRNPLPAVALRNLAVTLSDPSGEILPREVDTLPLPDLAPGADCALCFPVTVLPNAKVAPHSLRLAFSALALEQSVEFAVNYTVAVRQEIRLESGGLRMADSVVAGDTLTVSLPLMNLGRADVVNAMLTLSLPGIAERQSVLVGTIAPGETRQAQLTVSVPRDALGDYAGLFTVQGEDSDGNRVSFTLPTQLTVEEAVAAAQPEDGGGADRSASPLTLSLGAACVILSLGLIAQGALLRRKLHALEEARL